MKLNCKPGDLAVCVEGTENLGHVVKVIRALLPGEYFMSRCGKRFHHNIAKPCWITEGWFRWDFFGVTVEVQMSFDSMLRPLRPDEGDDETLTWAGKPEGVAA